MVLWKQENEKYNIKTYHIKQIRLNQNPINLTIKDINNLKELPPQEKATTLSPTPSNQQLHHRVYSSSS